MISKKIISLNIKLQGYFSSKNAIIFKINERVDSFYRIEATRARKALPDTIEFCQRPPFKNIILEFDDAVMWVVESIAEQVSENINGQRIRFPVLYCHTFDAHYINHCLIEDVSIDPALTLVMGGNNQTELLDAFYESWDGIYSGRITEQKDLWDLSIPKILLLRRFLAILSCKNIRAVESEKKVKIRNKKAQKTTFTIRYYTLEIDGTIGTGTSYAHTGGWTNSIHFVRGHMREYSEQKPLFGKYHGRFWIAPHARGDKQKGIVFKDYEMKA